MAISNIVLVHGGFVDGSGWQGVYDAADSRRLHGWRSCRTRRCHWTGTSPPPTRSSTASPGPGGPGRPLLRRCRDHRGRQRTPRSPRSLTSPRSRPDKGESVSSLIADPPPGAPVPPILPPGQRVPGTGPGEVRRLLRRRRAGRAGARSWPTRRCRGAWTRLPEPSPSRPGGASQTWYLFAGDDKMIPPPAQRAMAERDRGADRQRDPAAATPSTSPARPSSPPSSSRPPGTQRPPRSDGAKVAFRAAVGHRPGRLSAVAPELRS